MRVITSQALNESPALYQEVAQALREDKLIIFPTGRQYVLGASLLSEQAVLRLVQSKRRAGRAPALVFVPHRRLLDSIVDRVPPSALPLMDAFWPGPLTLLFDPSPELSPKVTKTILDRKRGKLGVRVDRGNSVVEGILRAFDGPVLVSSANLSRKVGASSVAQIKKNFTHTVDLLIDAGDIPPGPPSTIVDLTEGEPKILREGAIPAARIREVLEGTGQPAGPG